MEEELKEMIVSKNDIESRFGNDFNCAVKVIYKRNCRHPNKENLIFEAVPEIFKLVWRQKISLDLVVVFVVNCQFFRYQLQRNNVINRNLETEEQIDQAIDTFTTVLQQVTEDHVQKNAVNRKCYQMT